jgi:hypothetical protein
MLATAPSKELLARSWSRKASVLRKSAANSAHEFDTLKPDPDAAQGIDKRSLTVCCPRPYRKREHLRSVAQQACLVCGRKPSDPPTLGSQPRALGRKISDEFAVPLCRGYHRAVHRHAMSVRGGGKRELTRSKLLVGSGKTHGLGRRSLSDPHYVDRMALAIPLTQRTGR